MELRRIEVELLGALGDIAGSDRIEIYFDGPITVKGLIEELVRSVGSEEFRRAIFAHGSEDPRAYTLILVNGVEVGSMGLLDSEVADGSRVTLISLWHGG
ncbi:MAG: MoaD/ThiS family protein [Candidatus Bathyarchaeia archaeon]